jgi:hypothetical protein
MSNAKILPRQLSAAGCKQVGAALESTLAALSSKGVTLAANVDASAKAVIEVTQRLKAGSHEKESMSDLDHGTDDTIAPFYEWLYAAVEFYSHPHASLIPLTVEEQARLHHFRMLLEELFPEGTYFLSLRHRDQWQHLNRLQSTLAKAEVQSRLTALNLNTEASRISKWIERYGIRLGITKVDPNVTDPHSQLIHEWHEAWGDFSVDVRSAYKGKTDPSENALRDQLLSPYETHVEEERKKNRGRKGNREQGAA